MPYSTFKPGSPWDHYDPTKQATEKCRAGAKRTSGAKAVKRAAIYGTAEAVPFVGQSLPRGSFGAVQIAQPKKSNLDRSEVQPSPFDKLMSNNPVTDGM